MLGESLVWGSKVDSRKISVLLGESRRRPTIGRKKTHNWLLPIRGQLCAFSVLVELALVSDGVGIHAPEKSGTPATSPVRPLRLCWCLRDGLRGSEAVLVGLVVSFTPVVESMSRRCGCEIRNQRQHCSCTRLAHEPEWLVQLDGVKVRPVPAYQPVRTHCSSPR